MVISLYKKPFDWLKVVNVVTLVSYCFLFLILIYFISTIKNFFLLLVVICLGIGCFIKIAQYSKRLKNEIKNKYYWEWVLYEFIRDNKLYRETQERFEIYENGRSSIKSRTVIESSAEFSFKESSDKIIILGYKTGNIYSKRMESLDIELQGLLALPIESKEILPDVVKYTFLKSKPLRKQVSTSLPEQDDSLLIDIYGNFVINLRNNFSMLVSGSSGAGKSYFTYFYLTRFISQVIKNDKNNDNIRHAQLFAIDPKRSDLYKMFRQSGMPEENFGTTNAEAFKIVRNYLNELERRMSIYDESPAFDTVGIDIGLEPTLLVLEEYSSLVASMDSKQKKEFENMVAIIAQKARSLSMGILIVMQQPRADSLSSNIREQMINSVFLGNPSKESAGMMFGTTDLPEVTGKGVGLYSIERGTPKEFESPQFQGNVFEIILPVWKKVALNYHEQIKN